MENIVLCLEPTEHWFDEGRFVISENTSFNKRFLIGMQENFDDAGHKQIYEFVRNYLVSPDNEDTIRYYNARFLGRLIVLNSLKDAVQFRDMFLSSPPPISGGFYQVTGSNITFFGRSKRYGPTSGEVLQEFERPIREYCTSRGFDIQRLAIESNE
jgi:hypothetical protein